MLTPPADPIAQPARQHALGAYAALACIVFVFLYATAQLATPFLRHDDLNFLVPHNWPWGYATPWYNTLAEGRWIPWLWYHVSLSLTPHSAYALYILLYFIETCALVRLLAPGARRAVLFGLAVFFSPMLGELSLWPDGMTSVTILGAAALWALALADARHAVPLLFAATLVIVLAYPPVAALVLLAAAFKAGERPWRTKVWLGVAYLVAFALGILIVYTINYFAHGYFGVKVATWRHPNPLRDWASLIANLRLCLGMWHVLLHEYAWPIVLGVIAAALALWRRETRHTALAIVLACALIVCVQSGIALIAGVPVPTRSMMWLWLAICLWCGLLALRVGGATRAIACVLLAALTLIGAHAWWQLYRSKQPVAAFEAHLARDIQQYQAITGIDEVTVVGNPRNVAGLREMDLQSPVRALSMAMWSSYRIRITPCEDAFCAKAVAYAKAQGSHVTPLFTLDGKLALLFGTSGEALAHEDHIRPDYPSHDQAAALKLNYPPFLSYGADAARVTPFFPGVGAHPLSVSLSPSAAGYTLHAQGDACRYAVDYVLTADLANQLLAHGRYAGTAPLQLAGWGARAGTATLSLTMAPGAKNNYGCNIVITRN